MLHHIKMTNEKLKEAGTKKFILASQDVKALYPSLHIGKSAEIVRKAVETSKIDYEGIDMKWVGLVIAMAATEEEVTEWDLVELLPKRKYSGNRRPGLSSKEIYWSKDEWTEEKSLWQPTTTEFTRSQRES